MYCESHSSFEGVSSDHRIVTVKTSLSLRRNKEETVKTTRYDLSSLTNRDISHKHKVTIGNKFFASNDENENFVAAHMEAAAECIPTELRAKCRVPWESQVVRKKRESIKIASLLNERNPANANAEKRKKAQRELTLIKKSKKNTFKVESIE